MIRYYVPASSEDAARAAVTGIEIGRLPRLPEYLCPVKAAEAFESYPLGSRRGLTMWCIERRAVDDGVITNSRRIVCLGEIAAALMLVVGGSWLVGMGSLI